MINRILRAQPCIFDIIIVDHSSTDARVAQCICHFCRLYSFNGNFGSRSINIVRRRESGPPAFQFDKPGAFKDTDSAGLVRLIIRDGHS